jgi:pseudouridine-5'-monophosphatase
MYTDIIQQIANRYGDDKIYTYEIKSRLMGLMGREAAQAIVDALNLPIAPEEYMSLLQDTCQNFFPACQFLPGVLHAFRFSHTALSLIK